MVTVHKDGSKVALYAKPVDREGIGQTFPLVSSFIPLRVPLVFRKLRCTTIRRMFLQSIYKIQ